MEKAHPLLPTIKWAQRKDKLYVTVEIRDIKNEKIDLKPTGLSFLGESDEKQYEFSIEFFDEVDVNVRRECYVRSRSGRSSGSSCSSSS